MIFERHLRKGGKDNYTLSLLVLIPDYLKGVLKHFFAYVFTS